MTAYANTLKHFRAGPESAFGSADANDVPDISGLDAVSWPVDSAKVARAGGLVLLEDTTQRVGFAPRPGIPDSAWSVSTSKYVDRGGGQVTVGWKMRHHGSGSANVASSAGQLIALALATIMHGSTAASASVAVTGAGANAGEAELDAALAPGEVVMVTQSGKALANKVTGWGSDIATFLQRFPSALATAAILYRGTTFHASSGADTGTVGVPMFLDIAATSGRTVATGCRASSVAWSLDGGWLTVDVTWECAYLVQTDGPITIVPPEFPAGSFEAMSHRSCARYGTALTPASAPASVTAGDVVYLSDGFSITITAELTPVSPGASCSVVGMAEMKVTGLRCEASFDAHDINTAVGADFRSMGQRSWVFPFGPVSTGNGFAVVIPAGHFTEDPMLHAIDGPLAVQPYRLVAGPYSGDDASAGPTVNADFSVFVCGE